MSRGLTLRSESGGVVSRTRALLAALVLAASVLLGAAAPASQAEAPPPSFALPLSLDLHDGVVQKFGGTYYAYGTQYRCGFQWQVPSTWCGFGASSAPSLS